MIKTSLEHESELERNGCTVVNTEIFHECSTMKIKDMSNGSRTL